MFFSVILCFLFIFSLFVLCWGRYRIPLSATAFLSPPSVLPQSHCVYMCIYIYIHIFWGGVVFSLIFFSVCGLPFYWLSHSHTPLVILSPMQPWNHEKIHPERTQFGPNARAAQKREHLKKKSPKDWCTGRYSVLKPTQSKTYVKIHMFWNPKRQFAQICVLTSFRTCSQWDNNTPLPTQKTHFLLFLEGGTKQTQPITKSKKKSEPTAKATKISNFREQAKAQITQIWPLCRSAPPIPLKPWSVDKLLTFCGQIFNPGKGVKVDKLLTLKLHSLFLYMH